MDIISMREAKRTLPELVERAASGETIFIGAAGKMEVKLVAATEMAAPEKIFGILAGKLTVPENFDDPLPEDLLAAFEAPIK